MDTSLKYRAKFIANQNRFKAEYKKLFDKMAIDIGLLANDPHARFTKSFNFDKKITKEIDGIITNFHNDALKLTEDQIRKSWDFSNQKNDEIVNGYLKTITGLKSAETIAYFLPNVKALEAFIGRSKNSETLSDAVWKISNQLRQEVEIHLGMGITNGDSAQVISRRIRQYLNNPDALFKRVRDAKGNLVASKKMIENKPGQGVYNSSYKNALRVARTETNRSYLASDLLRWSQMDMVIGMEIRLSDSHPDYAKPEICEELAGIYPKDYVFLGNHPSCLCMAIPILASKEDFLHHMDTGEPLKSKQIKEYPSNFKDFWSTNYEKYSGYKQKPYIMEDNLKAINKVLKIK